LSATAVHVKRRPCSGADQWIRAALIDVARHEPHSPNRRGI
jgi:hypothetical protein